MYIYIYNNIFINYYYNYLIYNNYKKKIRSNSLRYHLFLSRIKRFSLATGGTYRYRRKSIRAITVATALQLSATAVSCGRV